MNTDNTNEEENVASVEHMRGAVLSRRGRESDAGESLEVRARVEPAPRPGWTLDSTVRDILQGGVNHPERVSIPVAVNIPDAVHFPPEVTPPVALTLNAFLLANLGSRGVVIDNENVTMEAFVTTPTMYIQDEDLIDHITKVPAYKRVVAELKRAREEFKLRESMWEVELERRQAEVERAQAELERAQVELERRRLLNEVADYLERVEVYSLEQWGGFNYKESIDPIARGVLNAALGEARRQEEARRQKAVPPDAAPVVIEGAYESVYNAKWHYVEGVGGEGFGMQVKEGHSPTPWTENEVMRGCVEEDNNNLKPVDGRLELMVLTSENGWPCTRFNTEESSGDIYVNKEVERVWHIIRKELNGWFDNPAHAIERLTRRVLIGTPGIGKSFASGSFLLHQLLHYDAERLPVVAYFRKGGAYLFERKSDGGGRVIWCEQERMAISVVSKFFMQNKGNKHKRGYIIYDVSEKSPKPPDQLPPSGWSMTVISSPDENQFAGWEKQEDARRIIMNCPILLDIKAMCAWEKRNHLDERPGYWTEIMKRIDNVGPLLRFIFSDKLYEIRCTTVKETLSEINPSNITEYSNILGKKGIWKEKKASHKLVKIYRVVKKDGDFQRNRSITMNLKLKIRARVLEVIGSPLLTALCTDIGAVNAAIFEKHGIDAFLFKSFVTALSKELNILQPPQRVKQESVLKRNDLIRFPSEGPLAFPISMGGPQRKIEFNRLYNPDIPNFPVVDGFYFVKSPEGKVTLIGVQATIAKTHPTTANAVGEFKRYLETCFSDWAVISEGLSWEIIYLQPYNKDPKQKISVCQECTLDPAGGYTNEQRIDIISFWNRDVNQYQVGFSPTLINELVEAYATSVRRKINLQ